MNYKLKFVRNEEPVWDITHKIEKRALNEWTWFNIWWFYCQIQLLQLEIEQITTEASLTCGKTTQTTQSRWWLWNPLLWWKTPGWQRANTDNYATVVLKQKGGLVLAFSGLFSRYLRVIHPGFDLCLVQVLVLVDSLEFVENIITWC